VVASNTCRKPALLGYGASATKEFLQKRTIKENESINESRRKRRKANRVPDPICSECQTTDFFSIFALRAAEIPRSGIPVASLGNRLNKITSCATCEFFSSMRDLDTAIAATHHLRAFSFFRQCETVKIGMMPKWIKENDNICLAVVPGDSDSNIDIDVKTFEKQCSLTGYILQARPHGLDLEAFGGRILGTSVHYSAVRSWMSYCQNHHSRSYAASGQLVQGLNLIDCETHAIMAAEQSHAYAALSYVWGSQHHKTSLAVSSSSVPPKVIEDTITVKNAV
jgi:hypothetical protein